MCRQTDRQSMWCWLVCSDSSIIVLLLTRRCRDVSDGPSNEMSSLLVCGDHTPELGVDWAGRPQGLCTRLSVRTTGRTSTGLVTRRAGGQSPDTMTDIKQQKQSDIDRLCLSVLRASIVAFFQPSSIKIFDIQLV